jgi:hypothetical protein
MAAGNLRRLENDHRAIREIFAGDPYVEIVEIGTAPFDKYKVIYKVPSLRLKQNGQPVRVEATNVEITLPNGYPRVPPVARTLGGEIVFHPNFSATKICLMDDWAPGVQLPDLIKEIGEMLQWQRYNINSPLNAQAAEWSQSHLHEIPLSDYVLGGPAIKIVIN